HLPHLARGDRPAEAALQQYAAGEVDAPAESFNRDGDQAQQDHGRCQRDGEAAVAQEIEPRRRHRATASFTPNQAAARPGRASSAHSSSQRVTTMAVNMLAKMPKPKVTAKPRTGPVPK